MGAQAEPAPAVHGREEDEAPGAQYGTNEFNFEKLPNPPTFKPTKCAHCKRRINLGTYGYTKKGKVYFCQRCLHVAMAR